MNDMMPVSPYIPEVQIPEQLIESLGNIKIGSPIKIKGIFKVKERSETGIDIDITGLYVERKSKHA